jgi:predicted  nucleic acid-binding Zn-ribbon protein
LQKKDNEIDDLKKNNKNNNNTNYETLNATLKEKDSLISKINKELEDLKSQMTEKEEELET